MDNHRRYTAGASAGGSAVGQTLSPLLLLLISCGTGGPVQQKVDFYSRQGTAGREVQVDCDRDGEILHLLLAADCRVAAELWVTVTHQGADGQDNKILCATNATPKCSINLPIPQKSSNPTQQPTLPMPVDIAVPELRQYPGQVIVELGGKCDTHETARGGTICTVKRP